MGPLGGVRRAMFFLSVFQGLGDSLWSVLGRNEKRWGRSRGLKVEQPVSRILILAPELYGGCSEIGCNPPWHRDEESGEMAVLGVEMWDRYRSRMLRSSRWRFLGQLSD